jgi:hypothetical protein
MRTTPDVVKQEAAPAHEHIFRHPTMGCNCSEGRIIKSGRAAFLPGVHDCRYIKQRDALIKVADRCATDAMRSRFPYSDPHKVPEWSGVFMAEMNRLAMDLKP